MFHIQLSELRKGRRCCPAPGTQRGAAQGSRDGGSAWQMGCPGSGCSSKDFARAAACRDPKAPAQESCRGVPGLSQPPAAPSPHWGHISPLTHQLQLQLHGDSLGRMQQGLGCRALWIICIIFSDSLSFACLLLSRQHSSHEDKPVAVRTEGVLPLTRDSAPGSAPFLE